MSQQQFPVAKPRKGSGNYKQQLLEAFQGFQSNAVDEKQIKLANYCIQFGENNYDLIRFQQIVEMNKELPNYLSVMTSVFDSLLKYVTNLLKPKRPPVWRSIRTDIAWFENRVDCIKGARDILKEAGYTVETADKMEFPPGVEEPDKHRLYHLAAELLMAKLEAERLSKAPQQTLPAPPPSYRSGDTRLMYNDSSTTERNLSGRNSGHFAGEGGLSPSMSRAGGVNSAGGSMPYRAGGGGEWSQGPSGGGMPPRAGVPRAGGNGVPAVPPRPEGGKPLRAGGEAPTVPPRAGDMSTSSSYAGSDGRGHERNVRFGDPTSKNYPPTIGNYPPPSGSYSPSTGHYPSGSYTPASGSYPAPSGNYPSTSGSYLPSSMGVNQADPYYQSTNDHSDVNRTESYLRESERSSPTTPPTVAPRVPRRPQSADSPTPSSSSAASTPLDTVPTLPPRTREPPSFQHRSKDVYSPQQERSHQESPHVPSPDSPATDVTSPQGSKENDLKKKLDELRAKRTRMIHVAATSTTIQPPVSSIPAPSESSQRKSRSVDHGAAQVDNSTPPSLDPTPPSLNPTSPSLSSSFTSGSSVGPALSNRSHMSIKHPPERSLHGHPTFQNDTILKGEEKFRPETIPEARVEGSVHPTSTPTDSKPCIKCHKILPQESKFCFECGSKQEVEKPPEPQPQERPCFKCQRRLSVTHKFCFHCGANQSEAETPPGTSAGSWPNIKSASPQVTPPPSGLPVRASAADTSLVEQSHRAKLQASPSLDRREVSGATGQSRELGPGLSQMQSKEEAYKRHLEIQAAGASGGRGSAGANLRGAAQNMPSTGATGGGASGSSTPSSSPGTQRKTGLDYLREKEKAWKDAQRKQGVKEEDLQPLPELVEAEQKEWEERHKKSEKREQQEKAHAPTQKRPTTSGEARPAGKYKRVDMLQNAYSEEKSDADRMGQLEKDGRELLQDIKKCTPYGYTIGEIHIAFKACKNSDKLTLRYLDTEWTQKIRKVCQQVKDRRNQDGFGVGQPKENVAREALVESNGRTEDAVTKIFQQREDKVKSLLSKFRYMREMDPSLQELQWDGAVKALTSNAMDVAAACYAIQSEWLQPLYEFIFSEYKKVAKTDMEEVKKIILDKKDLYSLDAKHRLLMAEYQFKEKFRAEIVLGLLEEVDGDYDYPLNYYVDAAKDFDDLKAASAFLNKECPFCGDIKPIHEMITMPGCTDSFCKDCFKQNFTVAIREKEIKHFNCPMCSLPDMMDRESTEGIYMTLFLAMIREHLDREVYRLCTQKLTDFRLIDEPGFMWCPNAVCTCGFIYDPDVPRIPRAVTCPNCKKDMCLKCKKPWETQHAGISCEQFAQWKTDNDPEAQKQGLAAHLNAMGIECPQCHMRYELARGGCMHFSCTRCPNEFCGGCDQSIKKGEQCGRLESCKKKGLHAHHPRDCLYYLRDFTVQELQDFLKGKGVKNFNVDPPKEQVKAAKKKMKQEQRQAAGNADGDAEEEDEGDDIADDDVKLTCCVMEQKESPDGKKEDGECGRKVEKGHAGLCDKHYREYLVSEINRLKLDPITLYTTNQIKIMLTREEMPIPEREEEEEEEGEETEEELRERLIKHVARVLPLRSGLAAPPPEQAEPAAPAEVPGADPLQVEDVEGENH